mgnify:CR=1 FL=1
MNEAEAVAVLRLCRFLSSLEDAAGGFFRA